MPLFLCLPLVGVAVLVACVARSNKPSASRAPAKAVAQQQFELDAGMPEDLVQGVLAALVLEADRTKLESYARQLEARFPLAASELRGKAAQRGAGAGASSPTSTPLFVPRSMTGDQGDAARVLQAAMMAYAQETDPSALEGFAASIRTRYPTATILLAERARELRAFGTVSVRTASALAPANAPASTSYLVRAGDTPARIAEHFTHDGHRWPELVAANPSKPTAPDGSFVSLRPGEALHLPPAWAPSPSPIASTAHQVQT